MVSLILVWPSVKALLENEMAKGSVESFFLFLLILPMRVVQTAKY